jgi:hypothetical protein
MIPAAVIGFVPPANAHTRPTELAHCYGNNLPNAPYFYIHTPAGVHFIRTGYSRRETVWFRAHFYRVVGSDWNLISNSSWFRTHVRRGTVTTHYWVRDSDGVRADWTPWEWADRGDAAYVIRYDLYWYQFGRRIHRDVGLWPIHTYDLHDGSDGNACYWQF